MTVLRLFINTNAREMYTIIKQPNDKIRLHFREFSVCISVNLIYPVFLMIAIVHNQLNRTWIQDYLQINSFHSFFFYSFNAFLFHTTNTTTDREALLLSSFLLLLSFLWNLVFNNPYQWYIHCVITLLNAYNHLHKNSFDIQNSSTIFIRWIASVFIGNHKPETGEGKFADFFCLKILCRIVI